MTKEVLIQLSKLITIFLKNKVKLPYMGEYKTKKKKEKENRH